jgi:hypothetical protein
MRIDEGFPAPSPRRSVIERPSLLFWELSFHGQMWRRRRRRGQWMKE